MKTKSLQVILAVLLLTCWAVPILASEQTQDNIYIRLRNIVKVLRLVRDNYVDEVNGSELADGAIEGILNELDPYSNYLSSSEIKEMTERMRGDFEGIGIEFDIRDGILTVISPIEGSPADKVGIRAGDKIVKINGKLAQGITVKEVYEKLRGPKGTEVDVSVKRQGEEELLEFEITRDKIPIYSIPYSFIIKPKVGYVRISRFSSKTGEELDQALSRLHKQGMEKLMIDLRWNSGGALSQAVEVADKFIKKGKICYTRGRTPDSNQDYYATKKTPYPEIPIVLLINRGSASASEIVAGAIQDHDRGIILGERSFGKGLVQRKFNLNNGGAILLTIARWYTPLGRLIQRPYTSNDTSKRPVFHTPKGRKVYGGGGITPDIKLEEDQLSKPVTELRKANAFFEFASKYLGEHTLKSRNFEEFKSDFQLTEKVLREFQDFLSEEDISFEKEDLKDNLSFIKRSIKAEIAGELWGKEEKYYIYTLGDSQVLRALDFFDKAESLLVRQIKKGGS